MIQGYFMSWFNLAIQGKSAWDSHSFVKDIATGGIVGRAVMHRILKPSSMYQNLRNNFASFFAGCFVTKLTPVSRRISGQILEKCLENYNQTPSENERSKLSQLPIMLYDRIQKTTKDEVLSVSWNVATFAAKSTLNYYLSNTEACVEITEKKEEAPGNPTFSCEALLDYVTKNYEYSDALELIPHIWNKQYEALSRKIIILALRPVCANAVQTSITALMKTIVAASFDFSIKKIISMTAVPILYGLAMTTFEYVAKTFAGNIVADDLGFTADHLPSTSTILWASTAYQAAHVGYAFWKSSCTIPSRNDLDKEKVKAVAFDLAKEPVKRRIQENQFFKMLKMKPDDQMVENIVKALIHESIDFYWDELHSMQYLGLPLVS